MGYLANERGKRLEFLMGEVYENIPNNLEEFREDMIVEWGMGRKSNFRRIGGVGKTPLKETY